MTFNIFDDPQKGIRCSHKDFWYLDGRLDSNKNPMSRCLNGFDGIGDGYLTNDCNGHGTHCAGNEISKKHHFVISKRTYAQI